MDIYELIEIEIKKSILNSQDQDPTELQRLLDIVYNKIYESKNPDTVRIYISKLSQVFHKIGDNTAAILAFTLMKKLNDINGVTITKQIPNDVKPEIDSLTIFIENEIVINNGEFNFFKNKKGKTSLGKRKLYSTALYMLKYFLREPTKENDDIAIPMVLLINIWEISPKLGRLYEFYIMYCSLLHRLHFCQQNQRVRDLAELSILLGLKNKTLHYSFYIKMAIYSRQLNVIDALLSAQLMLHGYNYTHKENELFLSKSLLELFISLRNFRLFPLAEEVKKAHDKLNVDDLYHKHQFDMALFNMKLLMDDKEIFTLVHEYLKNNDVLEFDIASGTPWLVLLLNLKRKNKTIFENSLYLTESLNRLEAHKEINQGSVIIDYKNSMSSNIEENKKAVLKGISYILKSRSYIDIGYELTTLQPLVLNLLKNSIKSIDYEGILIAHALSAGPIGFDINHEHTTMKLFPIKEGDDIPLLTVFNDYSNHISKLIEKSKQSVFLWIGICDEFCYSLSLKQGVFSLYVNNTFVRDDLKEWETSQTELLAFNDQPNLTSILDSNYNHWEKESQLIMNGLPILTDISKASDIILFRDVNIAYLPPNLIKTTSGSLLSELAPLHTPPSVEFYLKSENFNAETGNIKLWAPIEEGDIAINIAFDKIKYLFDDDSLLKITSLDPKNELNRDINIFISHGGKDEFYGFKSISPADNKYFIEEKSIFGTGKIAILFICHSGSSKSSMYATKLDGLVSKVLDLGYECVLAPAWSYNVILTGIWTRSFIDSLNAGKDLSESTYHANMSVKSDYPNIGAYAAMHIFGNNGLVLNNPYI